MKGFAFVLLCALVAVQGRHTGVQNTRSAAALGENPWVVHLRFAVGSSGLLNTCAGTLIDNRWVLTAASCVSDARFIWIRYGVVNVINPSLVTETSAVRINPGYDVASGANNIALISINRWVLFDGNINPITPNGEVGESGRFCGFSEDDSSPGEQLNCSDVDVSEEDGKISVSGDVRASRFDIGAPLVSNGAAVAILTGAGSEDSVGDFLATSDYVSWIQNETGISLNSPAAEVAPEIVHFVD